MENLPTPLSRVELYLAKACGMDVTVPERPLSRLEQFLAIIAGDTSIPMPTPMSLTEQWLAYVLGVTPDPLLAVEGACLIGAQKVDVRYFAVAASMPGATLPEAPQNRAEMYWAHIAVNPPTPGILKYVTGTNFYLRDVVSGIEELQYVKGDTHQQTDPAPSPDSPQDIQVVTGEQTVEVTGNNLFDMSTELGRSNVSSTTITGSTIKIESTANGNAYRSFLIPNSAELLGKTCTISFGQVNTHNHATGALGRFAIHQTNTSAGYYANNAIVSATNITSNYNYTFTFPDSFDSGQNGALLLLYVSQFGANNQTGDYAEFSNVQIELGNTPSSYEPYVAPQSYTINLGPIELCKIGDYQDYIYKSGDDWCVHKLIGNLVANGSEDWTRNGSGRQDLEMPNAAVGSASNNPVISTRYASRFSTSVNNSVFLSAYHRLCVYDTAHANNTEAWKTWLSSNNTVFYYALATPTDTKITDATLVGQLEALDSAPLPKPIANITVIATGTNLTPYLTIAYYGSDE